MALVSLTMYHCSCIISTPFRRYHIIIMTRLTFIVYHLLFVISVSAFAQTQTAEAITKENGFTIINTTTLADDVEGYAGPTPLKIYIKKDKIEKVEPLKNVETPKYWALIKRDLLDKWNGLTVKKAATQQVDVVTGATYSSEAVIENVRRGLDYYNKKK